MHEKQVEKEHDDVEQQPAILFGKKSGCQKAGFGVHVVSFLPQRSTKGTKRAVLLKFVDPLVPLCGPKNFDAKVRGFGLHWSDFCHEEAKRHKEGSALKVF
jgi:hypothetical protein